MVGHISLDQPALNVITTNNLNAEISSFFFCILLFYLFFEVLFSFFRKLCQNKSPIKPDKQHLHMLSYKILKFKFQNNDCNYLNSLFINIIYLVIIFPSIFIKENGLLCKYWFCFSIVLYICVYLRLNSLLKKKLIYNILTNMGKWRNWYTLVLGTSAARLKVRVSSCPPKIYESTSTVKKRFTNNIINYCW